MSESKLKKFYGQTGNVIINTDEGDVVIVVDINLIEILHTNDKICLCSYGEIEPDVYELFTAKWFFKIENYCGYLLDNSANKTGIYDIFAEAAITIIDKWYDENHCTCFATVSNHTKQQLTAFLIQYKIQNLNN